MHLNLDRVSISFANQPQAIVDDVSLSLARGDIGVLMGPSGCGKTTLIRAIAGLERLSQGEIQLQSRTISSTQIHQPPQQRHLGLVFQDYALFPHLNVLDNVRFGLSALPRAQQRERAQAVLEQVHLQDLGQRMPHQLSGGQQQRVALARALAPQPDLLLMDEPFSNLDRSLREQLAIELRDMLKAAGVTVLIVTHDLDEAFALGDRIGVMRAGQLLQWDRPEQLYGQPANAFVADFTGPCAWLHAQALSDGRVQTALGTHATHHHAPSGQACQVLLRASDVRIDADSPVRATIEHRIFKGDHVLYHAALPDGQSLYAHAPSDHQAPCGQSVGLSSRPTRLTWRMNAP